MDHSSATSKNPHHLNMTEDDIKMIQHIHIRLGRVVNTPFSGEYQSAFRGSGMEFEDVRIYVPGDDVRAIDWNVTARTGVPYIKEFREERALELMLVADVSASMSFGSQGKSKQKLMAYIIGVLAFSAIRSGDLVGMLKFANGVEEYCAPKRGRGHVWSLIRNVFSDPAQGKRSNFDKAIGHLSGQLKRRTTICVVSDFLFPPSPQLAALARRHRVHALLVHDPYEVNFPVSALIDVCDSESDEARLIDTRRLASGRDIEQDLYRLRKKGLRASALSTHEDPIAQVLAHFRRYRS